MKSASKHLLTIICLLEIVVMTFTGCSKSEIVESVVSGDYVYESGTKTSSDSSGNDSENNDSSKNSAGSDSKLDLGGKELIVAAWGTGAAPLASSATYQQELSLNTKLEKKYNFKFKWVVVEDCLKFHDTFVTNVMSGRKYADIIQLMSDQSFPRFALKKYIQPLDGYVDLSDVQWNKQLTNYTVLEGKHYGVTNNTFDGGDGIFFNKTIFKNLGAKDPYEYVNTNTWNWDSFLLAAKETTKEVGGIKYWGIGQSSSPVSPLNMIYSNGVSPVKRVDGKDTFNMEDPRVIKAIQFSYDLLNTYNVCEPLPANSSNYYINKFKKGEIAMMFSAYYVGNELNKALNNQVGFVYLPKGPDAKDYCNSSNGVAMWAIPSTCSEPEAVGRILTEWKSTQDWRQTRKQIMQSHFSDKQGLEIAMDMVLRGSSDNMYPFFPYFTQQVLWGNMGIIDKVSPQSYVASIKAASVQDINNIWSSK